MATGTAYGSWSSWCGAEEPHWPGPELVPSSAAYLACAAGEALAAVVVPFADGPVPVVVGVGLGQLTGESAAAAVVVVANWMVRCETLRASLAAEEETVEPS